MIDVEIEDQAWRDVQDVEALVTTSAQTALTSSPGAPAKADFTILLTSDAEVQDLNARFRGKDAPTNVLSFPTPPSAAPHLGDIALAHGVCAAEARVQGKTLAHHLSHLVVHGVLHLLSYDHAADADAEVMEAMERTVLAKLGIDDPYRVADGALDRLEEADARS